MSNNPAQNGSGAVADNAAAQKSKGGKKGLIIALVLVAVAVAAALIVVNIVLPAQRYEKAQELLNAGDYAEAIALLEQLDDYKDSVSLRVYAREKLKYAEAEELLAKGNTAGAAIAFGKMKDFEDAHDRSLALWAQFRESTNKETISAGIYHTVGLSESGSVYSAGDIDSGLWNTVFWSDMIAVSAGGSHTVGLKSDGHAIAVGGNSAQQCDLSFWWDIKLPNQ